MAHYERLSALDASFLGLEDADTHMHVGACMVFEAGPLRTPHGGIDIDRIREFIGGRLHLVPRFRQKLAYVPYERQPIWVDDTRFNLMYHVRHTALPQPHDDRVLKRLVGRIMSQPLDRHRPLWEMWFVEGLENDRFALINKTHHCMIDGISGADVMSVILEATDHCAVGAPRPWRPHPCPSRARLAVDAFKRRLGQPLEAARAAIEAVRDPQAAVAGLSEVASGLAQALAPALRPASPTPLQVDIGPHRRFDWLEMRLPEVKAVKDALGGTINDVVLATVAGALRRYFVRRGVEPDRLRVRALVPVSVRAKDEHGRLGNRVAEMMAPLPVHIDDPVARLDDVRETMTGLKESKQALGAEVLTAIAEWTVPNLMVQAVRLAERTRPYNLIVTNVPGPQLPLYLLGAEMSAAYPVVPLFHNLGIVVGLLSYHGGLFWGVNADWDHFQDLHEFKLSLEQSFRELQDAANRAGGKAAPRPRRAAARPRRERTAAHAQR